MVREGGHGEVGQQFFRANIFLLVPRNKNNIVQEKIRNESKKAGMDCRRDQDSHTGSTHIQKRPKEGIGHDSQPS